MADDELLFRPALDLAAAVRAREVSPVELARTALERIERLNGELNAVVHVDADGALEAARAAERRVTAAEDDVPPFLGVPTLIKDVHPVAGMRTTFGTRALAEFVPPFDAEHVRRLREAGFVFLGKTNVPEFGTVAQTEPELFGPARNPWDTSRTPGGSSGGAAAALAAGMVPVADGSDGGGSTRIPAAACGVFGLKPARGRVSNGPLFGDLYFGLVTPGPLTRTVADAAAMLDVMAGYAPGDPNWAPPPPRPFLDEARREPGCLRIGMLTESPLAHRTVGAEAVAATEELGRLLESLGHRVEPCTLPIPEQTEELFTDVWTAGLASNPIPRELLEPYNQRLAERGTAISGPKLIQSVSALQLIARGIVGASLAYDAIIYATLTHAPFRVGELAGLDPDEAYDRDATFVGFTPIANVTGQPAVSMPVGWSADGLPIGVSALGRPADEATLLRLAAQVEAATGWPSRRPPVS
ncbi:MAG TPA: amidase [Egibacteraceae bacterium]|nr:amidase [Egibacteraceae bacterium]